MIARITSTGDVGKKVLTYVRQKYGLDPAWAIIHVNGEKPTLDQRLKLWDIVSVSVSDTRHY